MLFMLNIYMHTETSIVDELVSLNNFCIVVSNFNIISLQHNHCALHIHHAHSFSLTNWFLKLLLFFKT